MASAVLFVAFLSVLFLSQWPDVAAAVAVPLAYAFTIIFPSCPSSTSFKALYTSGKTLVSTCFHLLRQWLGVELPPVNLPLVLKNGTLCLVSCSTTADSKAVQQASKLDPFRIAFDAWMLERSKNLPILVDLRHRPAICWHQERVPICPAPKKTKATSSKKTSQPPRSCAPPPTPAGTANSKARLTHKVVFGSTVWVQEAQPKPKAAKPFLTTTGPKPKAACKPKQPVAFNRSDPPPPKVVSSRKTASASSPATTIRRGSIVRDSGADFDALTVGSSSPSSLAPLSDVDDSFSLSTGGIVLQEGLLTSPPSAPRRRAPVRTWGGTFYDYPSQSDSEIYSVGEIIYINDLPYSPYEQDWARGPNSCRRAHRGWDSKIHWYNPQLDEAVIWRHGELVFIDGVPYYPQQPAGVFTHSKVWA